MGLIREEWYPAWDSGDAERLERVSRRVFAEDAELYPSGVDPRPLTLQEVLPFWLERLVTWKHQAHEILYEVEQGNKAAWEYRWRATHAGPIVVNGREVQATNRVFRNNAFVLAQAGRGGQIRLLRGASSFHAILHDLSAEPTC